MSYESCGMGDCRDRGLRESSRRGKSRVLEMSEVVPTHGKIDPEVERQRLARLYATMNDLELAEVAGEPTARSEWAFEALRDEMTKRGLDWAGAAPRWRLFERQHR